MMEQPIQHTISNVMAQLEKLILQTIHLSIFVDTIWGDLVMKKTWFCLILLLCLVLQGCPSPLTANNHPTSQKGTEWVSENGKVRFAIDPGEYLTPYYGTVETENGPVEIVISLSTHVTLVDFVLAEDFDIEKPLVTFARGQGDVNGKDEFVVRITSSNNEIFEVGEILVFHKVKTEL
jgi:hypothetical protein